MEKEEKQSKALTKEQIENASVSFEVKRDLTSEEILKELYQFLCTILKKEYHHIKENVSENHIKYEKKNQKIFNIRKKYIN